MCSVLLVLVVVSGALGQIPTPCGGPPSFTGNFRRFDRERQEFVEGKMFYDAVNQRIREFEFEKIGSTSAVYDKLKLYQTNTEYTVDLKTRKCNVTEPRPRTWFPFGVPPDARFSGEGTLGAVGVPNEQLTIAIFTGEFEGRDPYFVTVSQPSCFLVDIRVFRPNSSEPDEGREFYDVVSGITDPEAFIPSKECL